MLTKIEVTADDCRLGVPNSCWECPLALAIRRVCLRSASVTVLACAAHIIIGGVPGHKYVAIDLPDDEVRRVADFDAGCGMLPHSFELDLPEWCLRGE